MDDEDRIQELEAQLEKQEIRLREYEDYNADDDTRRGMIQAAEDAFKAQEKNIEAIKAFAASLSDTADGPEAVEALLDNVLEFDVHRLKAIDAAAQLLEYERRRAAFHKTRARTLRERRDQAQIETIQYEQNARELAKQDDLNSMYDRYVVASLLTSLQSFVDRLNNLRDRVAISRPPFAPYDDEDEEEVGRDEEQPLFPNDNIDPELLLEELDDVLAALETTQELTTFINNGEAETGNEDGNMVENNNEHEIDNDDEAEKDARIQDLTARLKDCESREHAFNADYAVSEAETEHYRQLCRAKDTLIQDLTGLLEACESREPFPSGLSEEEAEKYLQLSREKDAIIQDLTARLEACEAHKDATNGLSEEEAEGYLQLCRDNDAVIKDLKARLEACESHKGANNGLTEEEAKNYLELCRDNDYYNIVRSLGAHIKDGNELRARIKELVENEQRLYACLHDRQTVPFETYHEQVANLQHTIEEHEEKITNFEQTIDDLSREARRLDQAAERKDEALEDCEAKTTAQEDEIAELKEQLEKADCTFEHEHAIKEQSNRIAESIRAYNEVKVQLDKANAELKDAQEEISRLKEERVNPSTPSPKPSQNKLYAIAEENEEEDDEDHLSDLQISIQSLEKTIVGLCATIKNKEKEIDTLQEGRSHDEEIAALRKLIADLQAQILQLEKDLRTCKVSPFPPSLSY
jgi:hypothetical protein